jgi:hypothetical protein
VSNEGITKVRGAQYVAPLEQVESPVSEKPSSPDVVRIDAKLLNPPNVRFELAYEVRQALSADPSFAKLLARGAALNEPLLALSDALFPGVLRPDPKDVAAAIRALPAEKLRETFAGVETQTQRLDALLMAGPKDQQTAAIVDRGRAILAKLASSSGEKERAFLEEIAASSGAMGLLAEALDAKTTSSFLSKLKGASAVRLEQMVAFLRTDHLYRSMMQSMSPDRKDSCLSDQVERSAAFMTSTFGVPPARAHELASADRTKAEELLSGVLGKLRAEFGAVVETALAAVNVEGTLAPAAHVSQGGVIATRNAPFSATDRVPIAERQLREEISRVLGEALLLALPSDEKKLLRALDLPDSPRARRILASAMFEHYGTPEKLLADYQVDPKKWLEELSDLKTVLTDIEATEREAERAIRHRAKQLDAGLLVLPKETKAALEASMIAASPKEGLGYLLSDGEAVIFHPIQNDAKDAGFHGVQNADDLAKMNLFLEASGWFVLAQAHSHPNMRALYSPGDLQEMAGSVALAPGRRTVIAGVSDRRVELMSFASGHDGQVIGEDRIDVRR